MSHHDSSRTPRFCENCGAHNLVTATNCGVCGQPLVKPEDLAQLWGTDDEPRPAAQTEVIDLYPPFEMSSQATTPFTQTRPFDPLDARPTDPPSRGRVKAADPWSASAGKLSVEDRSAPPPFTPTEAPARAHVPPKRKGPPGFLLGCFAILLIAALGVAIVWAAVRESISNRVEDEIGIGITNELRRIDQVPIPASGRFVLTEQEINEDLDREAESYRPIDDVRLTIDPGSVRIQFKLYGLSSTYRSGLTVSAGTVIRAVDPRLSGPAGRVIDVDDITAVFESEIRELLRRSGVEPVSVTLGDEEIILQTSKLGQATS